MSRSTAPGSEGGGGRRRSFIARAARLASPEGKTLLRALLLLLEVDARLRLCGFARTRAALQRPPGAGRCPARPEDEMEEARRMAQALRRVAPYVPRARCLHRALSLLLWLRRRGVAAELCIGVRPRAAAPGGPAAATIEGHAWVEWRGTPLDEDRAACEVYGRFEPAGAGPLLDPPRP